MGYFSYISRAARLLHAGLKLTWRHFRKLGKSNYRGRSRGLQDTAAFTTPTGSITVRYPHEQFPSPDVARYRLFMETDDCIGCDQCARICPVDCITIEKIKAPDVIGMTTDGTKKRFWLPTFDIDLAKCCFCGLCTVVCPTECLIMTRVYDYSDFDRESFIHHFGNLSPEEARQKQRELEEYETMKKDLKAGA